MTLYNTHQFHDTIPSLYLVTFKHGAGLPERTVDPDSAVCIVIGRGVFSVD